MIDNCMREEGFDKLIDDLINNDNIDINKNVNMKGTDNHEQHV